MKNIKELKIPASLTAADLMTYDVVVVSPDDLVERVAALFQKYNIHHLPVINSLGVVVGIVSKADFLKVHHYFSIFATPQSEEMNKKLFRSLLVQEIMTEKVARIEPNTPIKKAVELFLCNQFHALPVIERGALKGILTTYDIINFFYKSQLQEERNRINSKINHF